MAWRSALATLACLLLAASSASAQASCASIGEVHACAEPSAHVDPRALAMSLERELAPVHGLEVEVLGEEPVTIHAHASSGIDPITLDVVLDRTSEDARAHALAAAVARIARRSASPWVDPRPEITPDEAETWYPLRLLRAPPAGVFLLDAHIAGMVSADRAGMAFAGSVSLEHVVIDHLVLGVRLLPTYVAIGENIAAPRAGIGALGEVRLEGDLGALGAYGGVVTLARTGGPPAAIVGLRLRIGPIDFLHAELSGSIALAPDLGVLFGRVRAEVLLPAGAELEVLAVRADLAPELGWMVAETGFRIFPDGVTGRGAGHFGVEIALGVQALDFQETCGFGPCPSRDWMVGPRVAVGLLHRFR